MSDHPDVYQWIADRKTNRALLTEPYITLPAPHVENNAEERRNAIRAVGFLEGFGAMLWNFVGPNLSDEEVAEYEKTLRASPRISDCRHGRIADVPSDGSRHD